MRQRMCGGSEKNKKTTTTLFFPKHSITIKFNFPAAHKWFGNKHEVLHFLMFSIV